jgi:hypothetical protein
MLKPFLILAVLVSPALADDKTTTLDFKLTVGKDVRHYALSVVSDSCGRLEAKSPQAHDQITVCMRPDGNTNLRLEVDWVTKHDDHELKNNSIVIASRGKSFDLDGGEAKLNVSVQ